MRSFGSRKRLGFVEEICRFRVGALTFYSDILLRNAIYMLCICDISASQMRYDINPRAARHISHAFMHISHRKVYRKSVFGFISLKRLSRFNNYEFFVNICTNRTF